MKIVVGLGNPGPTYVGTRHNVGFDVVDELAVRLGWVRSGDEFDRLARSRFDALALDGVLTTSAGQEKLLLLKPQTFMNLSGRTVAEAVRFFQCPLSDLLVVLDDMALPCGTLRLRADGSSGGHNGLKDIERALGTSAYPRLRVGIDGPPPRIPGRDYVLQRFTPEQAARVKPAVVRAASAVVTWADRGIVAAMNQFNTHPEPPSAAAGPGTDGPARRPCGETEEEPTR